MIAYPAGEMSTPEEIKQSLAMGITYIAWAPYGSGRIISCGPYKPGWMRVETLEGSTTGSAKLSAETVLETDDPVLAAHVLNNLAP